MGENKRIKLQVRVTAEERELVTQASQSVGLTISEFVRRYMLPIASALMSGDEQKYLQVSDNLKDAMIRLYKVERDT